MNRKKLTGIILLLFGLAVLFLALKTPRFIREIHGIEWRIAIGIIALFAIGAGVLNIFCRSNHRKKGNDHTDWM